MSDESRKVLPMHVAIIMDGNGRWAVRRGLPRVLGHREGVNAVRRVVRAASDAGLKRLTLFAFSQENWSRPPVEVNELMALLQHYLRAELNEMMKNRIRIKAIGRLHELQAGVRALLDETIMKTEANDAMTLTFALSYGGRQEIADAARAAAKDVLEGRLPLDQLDEITFARYLCTREDPDPDLLIRTGGEERVSNFLLWQIAYAELYVTDTLWPDFGKEHLQAALDDFAARERRFGLTSEQVRAGRKR
ncbi:MAG: di-trans,poly-cis-decaprenylcistransferase [Deltaproteobacteria bacterium RBG_13_65_10]|nr:MAG: di-trans,poly-cis-decaprenylcistransferase [Deltaproteobacteria bacterium RBG_13_65_10]